MMIRDRFEHSLVQAIIEAALDHGMTCYREEFSNFYAAVKDLVLNYDQGRSDLLDQYEKLILDREMVTPSRVILIKEKE